MRKCEKEFISLRNSDCSNVTFDSIKSQINTDKYINENEKSNFLSKFLNAKVLVPTSLALVLVSGIGIGATIPFLTKESSKKITGLNIENFNAIVTEYEKNMSFIPSGFELANLLDNGKTSQVLQDDLSVDYSEFNEGVKGRYSIKLSNKKTNKETSYDVEVLDLDVVEIKLLNYRQNYYFGEKILPQDLKLVKVRSDGSEVVCKSTEYSIDESNFDNTQKGTYDVSVSLIGNKEFKLDYQVSVIDYDEHIFDGKYSYLIDSYKYGSPTVYAFEIKNGAISSYYSEILLNGSLNFDFNGNNLVASCDGHSQKMRYNPDKRSFIVSGIAGDPDMECFKLFDGDYLLEIKGELVTYSQDKYVAKEGTLPYATYAYLVHNYGGVYFDSKLSQEINCQSEFNQDMIVNVGTKQDTDSNKEYVGIWYREDWHKLIYFENNMTIHSGNSNNANPFTATKDSDGNYVIRSTNHDVMIFNPIEDTLSLLDPETGEVYLVYHRFDEHTQIIVTLKFDQYVLNKGDSFVPMKVEQDRITFYRMNNYNGEPLYENADFSSVTTSMIDMTLYNDYIYGNIHHYYRIESNDWDDKLKTGWQYVLVEYLEYEEVSRGYLAFNNYNLKTDIVTFEVTPFDQNKEKCRFNVDRIQVQENDKTYYSKRINIDGVYYQENRYPFIELNVLGSYFSNEGDEIVLTSRGVLGIVKYSPSGSKSVSYEYPLLKSVSENEVVFLLKDYYEPDSSARFNYYEFKVTLENGQYYFIYNGKKYVRSDEPSENYLESETFFTYYQ